MKNAVDAAVDAQVPLIAYTGFVNTPTSTLRLANEHKQAEAYIRQSGIPFVFLRNGGYTELYTGELGDLAPALDSGVMYGCGADGKVSGASRADLAAAAAAVLTGQGHAGSVYGAGSTGRVYELGGTPFTLADVAAEISRQAGKPLVYQDLPIDRYAQALAAQGVPQAFADLLADTSLAVTHGDWFTPSTDLEQLLGRPATALADVVAAQLKAL